MASNGFLLVPVFKAIERHSAEKKQHTRSFLAMRFLGVCNARRATNLVTEVCNGGP